MQSLPGIFKDPPRQFSPVPIWWWSGDRLERSRLRWQLERFAEGGIYNLVVMNLAPTSPLYGSDPDDPPFFSEDWWQIFLGVCADAKELGIYLWIYDQIGFSGANLQGQLTHRHPEYAGQSIERITVLSDGTTTLQCPAGGTPLIAYAVPVDDSGNPVGEPTTWQIVGRSLHWDGKGRHRVALVYAIRHGFDYCSPAACAALIDMVHGEFARRAGAYLGSVIVGSFQDELPSMPTWSPTFAQEFQQRCGYDIISVLPALWEDYSMGAEKVRVDYQRVRAALAEEAFFIPLHQWHERYNMLCGFDQQGPARDGHPVETVKFYADYLRTHRWFTAPGSDHHGEAKIHSSLAHLYNRPRVWIEAFHSSSWGGTLEETYDWLLPWLRAGANLYDPHAVYYSTRGGWWEWAPPSTCWRQPYWRHYSIFAKAVSRLCAALSVGEHVCDIGVLFPASTVQAGLLLDGPTAAAKRAHNAYLALAGRMVWFDPRPGVLDRDRRDFDVLDEDSVQRGLVTDAALQIGNERYKAIILPACQVLAAETAVMLQQFVDAGGLLIAVDTVPAYGTGCAGDDSVVALLGAQFGRRDNAILVESVEDVPTSLAKLERRVDAPVPTLLRKADGRDLLFIPAAHPGASQTNSSRGPQLQLSFDPSRYATSMQVRIRSVQGVPWLWDPFTGGRRKLEAVSTGDVMDVTVPFDLGPAALIVWETDAQATELEVLPSVNTIQKSTVQELGGEWQVRYVATMDNRWGDFAQPAYAGAPPAQRWSFLHAVEQPAGSGVEQGWHRSEFDDSEWRSVQASFGQYGWYCGPTAAGMPNQRDREWRPVVYSLSRGIYKDGLHAPTLGPKGHVPEEFLAFGQVKAGQSVRFRTSVHVEQAQQVHLAIGAPAKKLAWINGTLINEDTSGYLWQTPVELQAGLNAIEFELIAEEDLQLRAFYAFVTDPSAFIRPEWLNTTDSSQKDSVVRYSHDVELPWAPHSGKIQVGSDAPCRIFINDKEVGRQGDFDPYYRSARVQPYDISGYLQAGSNRIAIELTDSGRPASAFVDGLVTGPNGEEVVIISDAGWRACRNGETVDVRLRRKPWGDPAWCQLRRRPHPLPASDWIEDKKNNGVVIPFPADAFAGKARVEWLRFLVPPGAVSMSVPVVGTATVYVDGVEVPITEQQVQLPKPHKARRVCAMRITPAPGRSGGGVLDGPIVFQLSDEGRMPLGDWSSNGLTAYSGGVSYSRDVQIPLDYSGCQAILDLGWVRGTTEVSVNGKQVGARVLSPHRYDVTDFLQPGWNKLVITVFNTLGPYMEAVSPTRYVIPGQTASGLYGPVTLYLQ